jgi:N utilization substance protein A
MDLITLDEATNTHEAPEGATTVSGVLTRTSPDIATVRTAGGEELVLPVTEWPRPRRWARGEHIIALRTVVAGRPTLSLTSPALVTLVAEGIVPELRDGRVRVMGVAREPGVRTKLAVAATVDGVDAVASCVGRGASRVRMLMAQLGGERVDVIAWDPDRLRYLANALAPARVGDIRVLDDSDEVEVVAPRHQMAAAVGEGGLNSQLAGRLAGFAVTVVSE